MAVSFESAERLRGGYRVCFWLGLVGHDIAVEGDRVTAEAEFSILRFDFDISYEGKADDLIRDAVLIKLNLIGVPATES